MSFESNEVDSQTSATRTESTERGRIKLYELNVSTELLLTSVSSLYQIFYLHTHFWDISIEFSDFKGEMKVKSISLAFDGMILRILGLLKGGKSCKLLGRGSWNFQETGTTQISIEKLVLILKNVEI